MNSHGTVTRDTGGGVTVPRPDPTRPISNYSSIYLTVGVAQAPETWMETDDLDLLDDDKRHARCGLCQPTPRALETFKALCGARALARSEHSSPETPPNACLKCLAYTSCPDCGAS